eukprot:m.211890 g.211890  ORF g.211890 m.211890 type:complete len:473 (+) comp33111_c0_seq2:340-1758(+)
MRGYHPNPYSRASPDFADVEPKNCSLWRPVLHQANALALTQQIVGISTFFGCVLVVFLILAYRKDVNSFRYRLLLAVFFSNSMYSLSDAIPFDLFHTSGPRCGYAVLTTDQSLFKSISGQAAFLFLYCFGLYASCSTELAMVIVSINSLLTGQLNISKWIEVSMYVVCAVVAMAAASEVARDSVVDKNAEYEATYAANTTAQYDAIISSEIAQEVAASYWFFGFPVAVVSLSLVLWIYQRYRLYHLTKEWNQTVFDASKKVGRSKVQELTRIKLLLIQREGYTEITKPLERYVVVFVIFLPPLIYAMTKECSKQSVIQFYYWNEIPCLNYTLLVLSFRSLGLVVAYFGTPAHRKDLYDHVTFRKKLCIRIKSFGCCCSRPLAPKEGSRVRFSRRNDTCVFDKHESVVSISRRNSTTATNNRDHDVDDDHETLIDPSSLRLHSQKYDEVAINNDDDYHDGMHISHQPYILLDN